MRPRRHCLQHRQSKAVAVTSLSFMPADVNNFVVGSEEGAVYAACRHGRCVPAKITAASLIFTESFVFGVHVDCTIIRLPIRRWCCCSQLLRYLRDVILQQSWRKRSIRRSRGSCDGHSHKLSTGKYRLLSVLPQLQLRLDRQTLECQGQLKVTTLYPSISL